MRFQLFLFFILIPFVPSVARAQEAAASSSEASGEQSSVGDGSMAKIAVATPTPIAGSEVNENGEIEPLDAWYVPAPTPVAKVAPNPEQVKKEAEIKNNAPAEDEEDDEEDEDEPVELESVDTDAQLPEQAANAAALKNALRPRRIQLTKPQKRRLKDARITRHQVMKEKAKALGLDQVKVGDPRGLPEMTICSLNLNNYGTVKDFTRIFKNAQLPRRERTENSSLSTISKRGCDLVALQGILGQTNTTAEEAITHFVAKLKSRTGVEWKFFLGESGRGIVRNGFVYKSGLGETIKEKSFGDVPLLSFGSFNQREFGRAPVEVILRVKSKHTEVLRDIIFLNFHFQQGFVDKIVESEASRMQLADAVRQIIHSEQQTYAPETPPIVVMLGDRSGPLEAPATQLLEGRMRLLDFTQNGGCALSPVGKVECKTPPTHLKEFFGLTAEGILLEPKIKKVKVDEVEQRKLVYPSKKAEEKAFRARGEKNSEIYVLGPDVEYFQVEVNQRGRYIAGVDAVRTDLKRSPLVWTVLNF